MKEEDQIKTVAIIYIMLILFLICSFTYRQLDKNDIPCDCCLKNGSHERIK